MSFFDDDRFEHELEAELDRLRDDEEPFPAFAPPFDAPRSPRGRAEEKAYRRQIRDREAKRASSNIFEKVRDVVLENPKEVEKVTYALAQVIGTLLARRYVIRALMTQGISKRDARAITNGLSGATSIVTMGVLQYRTAYEEMHKVDV